MIFCVFKLALLITRIPITWLSYNLVGVCTLLLHAGRMWQFLGLKVFNYWLIICIWKIYMQLITPGFLKGVSSSRIGLSEQELCTPSHWDFEYFNSSKLNRLLYFIHTSAPWIKVANICRDIDIHYNNPLIHNGITYKQILVLIFPYHGFILYANLQNSTSLKIID